MPALVILSLCAFAITCYGWGRVAFSLSYPGRRPLHAYSVALGLVGLGFVGGVLNAVGAASAGPRSIAVYVGLALGIIFICQSGRAFAWRSLFTATKIPEWLFAFVVLGLGVFLAETLFPTRGFNQHDDFFTYLPRPVRMLTTGTLGGNPFELLGFTDFGVQSFLVAALMTWLPLTAAYAFDSVFCFLLGLVLLVEIGCDRNCARPSIALAMAGYVLLDPQIVNISSVYSMTVFVLTLLIAVGFVLHGLDGDRSGWRLAPLCAPVGATIATLFAIKLTSAVFIASFCAIMLVALLHKDFRKGAVVTMASAASALVTFLPWLITHADKLDPRTWNVPGPTDPALTTYSSVAEAFRDQPGIYGATRADYIVAAVALLISLAASTIKMVRRPQEVDHLSNIAATTGGIGVFVGLTAFIDNEGALRYAIPFLIAITPYTLLYQRSVFAWTGEGGAVWRRGFVILTIAVQVILLAAFSGYGYQRLKRFAELHVAVSFRVNPQWLAFMAYSLSEQTRGYVLDVQSRIPAGATILAWVDTPFDLDFARNRVWHLPHDWHMAPWWADVANSDELRKVLEAHDVDYILWQYRTQLIMTPQVLEESLQTPQWVTRRRNLQNLHSMLLALERLPNPSEVMFNDGKTAVIALKPRAR